MSSTFWESVLQGRWTTERAQFLGQDSEIGQQLVHFFIGPTERLLEFVAGDIRVTANQGNEVRDPAASDASVWGTVGYQCGHAQVCPFRCAY